MAVITAANFRSIFTVIENQRPPGGPHRSSRPSHLHHDRPGGACASGIRSLEAGTSLLIDCGGWLRSEDFTRRFIITGTGSQDHLRGNSVAAQINLSAGRAAHSIDTTI